MTKTKLDTKFKLIFVILIVFTCLFVVFSFKSVINNSDINRIVNNAYERISINNLIRNNNQKNSKDIYNFNVYNVSSPINKFALLSVSILPDREFYYFQLPMIVKAWERIGFRTIVMIISSNFPIENRLALKTIEYIKRFNAIVLYVDTPKHYEVIVSLVMRLFGGLLDDNIVKDEDFIITSDSDLYPVDRKYYLYDEDLMKNDTCYLYNAYCCGPFWYKNKNYTMFPMGHIGMKKKYWRKVMNLENYKVNNTRLDSELVLKELRQFFSGVTNVNNNSLINRGDNNWDMDQKMISVNLHEHHLRTNKTFNLVKFEHNCRRLDRSEFNTLGYDMTQFCDIHAFHQEIYNKLDIMEKIFENMFDVETVFRIKNYHQEFVKIKFYLN